MISLELWRAKIGLFNCSRRPPSSSLFTNLQHHQSMAHGSFLSGQGHGGAGLFSSLCRSLLIRRALALLLVAIITHLLLSAGDVEQNPGPITADSPLTVIYLLEACRDVTNWLELGLCLGLEMNKLYAIQDDFHGFRLNRLKMEMFNVWLMSSPSASWSDLIRALRTMNEHRIAEEIESAITQAPIVSDPAGSGTDASSSTLSMADMVDVMDILKDLNEWKYLGLQLGLSFPTLQRIEMEQRGRISNCLIKMITAWLEQRDNVYQVGLPSWSVLKAALQKIDENALAEKIGDNRLGHSVQQPHPIPTPAAPPSAASEQPSLPSGEIMVWQVSPEVETLRTKFDYLVHVISVSSILPKARAKLITVDDYDDCKAERTDSRKAQKLLEFLEKAVISDPRKFDTFVGILDNIGQPAVAQRLRDTIAEYRHTRQNPGSTGVDAYIAGPHVPSSSRKRILDQPSNSSSESATTDTSPTSPESAEKEKEITKKYFQNRRNVKVRSLKAFLIGPSRVGKTSTRRRLTREITHVSPDDKSPSTGIDPPVTVSVLMAKKGWKGLNLGEQFRDLCSLLHQLVTKDKQSTPEQLLVQPLPKRSRPSATETSTSTDLLDPSHQSSQQYKAKIHDEVITELSTLVENEDWEKIQEFLAEAGVLDLLHIVDVGGQPEFHEILPFLLHGPALNLIFFNLEKELNKKFMVEYDDAVETNTTSYTSDCTVQEVIERALGTISSLQTSSHHDPKAILIGTHFKTSREAEFLRRDDYIQTNFKSDWFMNDGVLCPVCEAAVSPVSEAAAKKRYVYFLNNTEDSNDIDGLRDLIRNVIEEQFPAEDVTTPRLLLHLFLRMKYEDKPGWCFMEDCKVLAKKCGIIGDEAVADALKFLHDKFGTILYYHDLVGKKIRNRIIVNVKLVLKLPAEMIKGAFLEREKKDEESVRMTGEVTKKELIKYACYSESENEIPIDEILELLEYRYILYKSLTKKDTYFMPCLLKPDEDMDASNPESLTKLSCSPLLLIPYKKGSEFDSCPPLHFVPLGIFQAAVVRLCQEKGFRLRSGRRFRNRICFFYKNNLEVEIRSLSTHLEIRIVNDPNCSLIVTFRGVLWDLFKDVASKMPYAEQVCWGLGLYCPKGLQSDKKVPVHFATFSMDAEFGENVTFDEDSVSRVVCENEGCYNSSISLEENSQKCWFVVPKIASMKKSPENNEGRTETDSASGADSTPPLDPIPPGGSPKDDSIVILEDDIPRQKRPRQQNQVIQDDRFSPPQKKQKQDEEPKYSIDDEQPQPSALSKEEYEFMKNHHVEKVRIVIQTCNDAEYYAVLEKFEPPRIENRKFEKPVKYFHKDIRIIIGTFADIDAAIVETGQGIESIEDLKTAVNAFKGAKFLLGLGICYGIKGNSLKIDLKFADVLVSYEMGKSKRPKLKREGVDPRELIERMSTIMTNTFCVRPMENYTGIVVSDDPKERTAEVYVGRVLSTPLLMNDGDRLGLIKKEWRGYLGGEMEGWVQLEIPEVDSIIIKGIADFADGNKNDKWQLTAAKAAVHYAHHKLKSGGYIPFDEL